MHRCSWMKSCYTVPSQVSSAAPCRLMLQTSQTSHESVCFLGAYSFAVLQIYHFGNELRGQIQVNISVSVLLYLKYRCCRSKKHQTDSSLYSKPIWHNLHKNKLWLKRQMRLKTQERGCRLEELNAHKF